MSSLKNNRHFDVVLVPFASKDTKFRTGRIRRARTDVTKQNQTRNRFVANLVKSLLEDPRRAVKNLGVDGKPAVAKQVCPNEVVVLTETDDQAWFLKEVLPKSNVFDEAPFESEEAAISAMRNFNKRYLPIATLVYAYRHRLTCNILVRVTAGSGKLSWLPGNDQLLLTKKPDLIIDIADGSHPGDVEDVELRCKEYLEQGLRVVTSIRTSKNAA